MRARFVRFAVVSLSILTVCLPSQAATYAAIAQTRAVPPGVIVFSHEDSGSMVPAQQYSNLYRMDAQNPTPPVRLTNFTQAATTATKPAWAKDFSRLAFESTFNNGFPSLETTSSFAIGLDGSNLRPVTGLSAIHALPNPPAGTVTGKVVAPTACPPLGQCLTDGQLNTCIINVQGSTQSAGCAADGSFTITNVPLTSAWVRVLANVTYSKTPAEPGQSLGFKPIQFGANGTADVGTIEPVPQFPNSIEPAWSRDGSQLITTHYVSGLVLNYNITLGTYYWVRSQHNELWIWSADGKTFHLVPNLPEPETFGSDWSPVAPDRICFATGSANGNFDSRIYLANPDGSNQFEVYHVPFPGTTLSLPAFCRFSPDGQRLAFTQINENASFGWWGDLYVINIDGSGLKQLTHNAVGSFSEVPSWSPDGQALAYETAINSGSSPVPPATSIDLFVIDPATGTTTRLTTDGRSSNPTWGRGPASAVLPALANAAYGGYTTVAYIQNTGTAPAAIYLQYVDAGGNPVGSGDSVMDLPPRASWTVRQDNGHAFPAGGAGSGIILSNQPIAAFVNEFAPHNAGDATSYSAIPLPGGAGSTLSAPAIASNAYGGYTTAIGLINLASTATDITLTYRKGDGTIQATQTLTGVAPGAYRGVYSGTSGASTDANLPAGFAGTASVESSAGAVAAIVNETGPNGQFSSYDAVAAGAATLAAPTVLNNAYGGYNTAIGLQNLSATAANVTISYSGQVGGGTATQTFQEHLTLAPFGYAGDYNGGGSTNAVLPDGFHGSATIQSDQPLASIVNEVAAPATAGGPTTQSTAYNTFAAGVGAAHLPLVENAGSDGVTTGVGIENISSGTASVMIAYYDSSSGALLTQKTVNIAPGSFLGEYTPADLTTAGTRATAVISTSGNALAVIVNEVGPDMFMSYDAQ